MTKNMSKIAGLTGLMVLALVGCTPDKTDHVTTPGPGREFNYTNRYGEIMHCVVWDEGQKWATVGCIPAQKTIPEPK